MAAPTTRLETSMRLVVPKDPQLLRVVRLVASGVASLAGCDLDQVEGVRVAADELVATLMEAGGAGEVTIELEIHPGALRIEATTEPTPGATLTVDPLSDRILDTVASRHDWTTEGNRVGGSVEVDLPARH